MKKYLIILLAFNLCGCTLVFKAEKPVVFDPAQEAMNQQIRQLQLDRLLNGAPIQELELQKLQREKIYFGSE